MTEKAYFVAGKFGAAQGIKGLVRVISFMEFEDDIFDSGSWFITAKTHQLVCPQLNLKPLTGVDADEPADQSQPLKLVEVTPTHWQNHPKGYAVALPGVTDRNQAQLLTHQFIYIALDSLKALDGDSYYWRQLIGLQVQDAAGTFQGRLTEMLETGANDVMVVISEPAVGSTETTIAQRTLVPYIPDEVIKSVDLEAGIIVLDWSFNENADDDAEISNCSELISSDSSSAAH